MFPEVKKSSFFGWVVLLFSFWSQTPSEEKYPQVKLDSIFPQVLGVKMKKMFGNLLITYFPKDPKDLVDILLVDVIGKYTSPMDLC